ncbi:MAG: Mth938-like domain-containing protein [Arhodomonas sp.]|uniref:Mth938-like domain-containing protein n=1 Tax=Arhodomonas sp. SL1 TaxID=3425691 RepID=UPI002ADC3D2D|nr:Mth938-like domain-containing protein [Arhodomonas sp.]
MKLTEERGDGSYRIRGYDAGRIVVNETSYTTSLVLAPEALDAQWPPQRFEELAREHFDPVLALEPEVVLLGTGETQRFPSRAVMLAVLERGIGMEVMDTAAACRTYNILMAEGRRVTAALLLR